MRLAELMATFSVAADTGLGMPTDHGLRASVIAARLGRIAGMSEREQIDGYYLSLQALRHRPSSAGMERAGRRS